MEALNFYSYLYFKIRAELSTTHIDDKLWTSAPATGFITPKNARASAPRLKNMLNAILALMVFKAWRESLMPYGTALISSPAMDI